MRLLFSAHDAGGGDALVPIIRTFFGDSSSAMLCILGGKSKEVFTRESIPFVDGEKLSDGELAKEINAFSPEAIITGTSFGLSVDKRVLRWALKQKIPTLSIIDYWSNYQVRFQNPESREMLLPDKICVIDELMKAEMLVEGFPEEKILVTGNPRFERFRKALLPEKAVPGQILFVSQPFTELQEQNLGIGYTEMDALKDVVEVLEELNVKNKNLRLIIRPHPREAQEKFTAFLQNNKIPTKIDSQSSIPELLSTSEIIVGMTSVVMFEAAMYQKKVLVYQPDVQKDLSILQKLGIGKTITDKETLALRIPELLLDKRIESHNYTNLIKKYTQNNSTEKVISIIKSLITRTIDGEHKQMNILAIIPARGGSKSIPRKNVKLLGSKPLIAYPIELAKSVPEINKIIVSTDDREIAEISEKYGAEVPFMRPSELAQDVTPTLPVLQHAVEFLEKNQNYKADIIALLYPTNPFLQKETVQKALRTLMEGIKGESSGKNDTNGKNHCHTVISVVEDWGRFWKKNEQTGEYFPFHPLERVNRQYYKPLLRENGAIYFSDYETIMVKNKIVDDSAVQFVVMQPGELIDLDTPEDWEEAEKRVIRQKGTEQKERVTELKIGSQLVGKNHPCFIIAEAGANFRISNDPQINFQQALRLIDLAAEAKADAVKFQLYRDDKLYVRGAGHANYLGKSKSINQIIQEMELPYEWLPILKKRCDENGIIFLCSPFDETAVEELEKVGIAAYKMASYSVNNLSFLKYVASKGKPIILSTGAANEEDIRKAVAAIKSAGNEQIALLQCTAKYPAPLETINLQTIPLLKERFGVISGLSDHSREPSLAPLGAVALGAKIVEKHFTTDNSLPGPDHGFAILDTELVQLVHDIRNLEKCLGSKEKKVLEEEKELYEFARSRIHASRGIKWGEVFSRENIAILRSGLRERGLEPEYWEKVLGKVSRRNISVGEPITKEDL